MTSATAALSADEARIAAAERAINAAVHQVELYEVNIADNSLVAPKDGPDRIPRRQRRRSIAGRWQGLHHARRLLRLYGYLPADRVRLAA